MMEEYCARTPRRLLRQHRSAQALLRDPQVEPLGALWSAARLDHRAAPRAVGDARAARRARARRRARLEKFNRWRMERSEVWEYVREHRVPYNPLYDQGYRSIGCAPCTPPGRPREDARAGRWWWEMSSTANAHPSQTGTDHVFLASRALHEVAAEKTWSSCFRDHLDWLESEAISSCARSRPVQNRCCSLRRQGFDLPAAPG